MDRGALDGTDSRATSRAMRDIFLAFTKENKGMTALGFASLLVVPVQDVLVPHLIGRLINSVKAPQRVGAARRAAGKVANPVLKPLTVLVAVILFLQVCYALVDVLDARLYPAMMNFVRRHMFRCTMALHEGALAGELNNGELLSKFSKVPSTVTFWFESVKAFLPHVLVLLSAAAYFSYVDRVLGLVIVATVAVTFVCMHLSVRMCTDVSSRRDHALNSVQEGIDDALRNLPSVFTNMKHGEEQARLEVAERRASELYVDTVSCAIRMRIFVVPAVVFMVAFVIFHGRKRVADGRMSAGHLVSIILVVLYMMNSLIRMSAHGKSIVYHWGVINASNDVLAECSDIGERRRAGGGDARQQRDQVPAALALPRSGFGAVGARYGVFRRLTLHVEEGERVAIVGPIGSGKSTLLKLIVRLIEPEAGVMYLRGRPYSELSLEQVRGEFAYVPQTPLLWDRTVLENILYGNDGYGEDDVWRRAEELGLSDALQQVSLHRQAGKAGSQLSGGQRQVVWLLRATLRPGRALLLDEPSASLDPQTSAVVARAVQRSRRTCVIVTHDREFAAAVATRVVQFSSLLAVGP
jgi:ABC-type multidrug transport system fused ATPase/permease subunit